MSPADYRVALAERFEATLAREFHPIAAEDLQWIETTQQYMSTRVDELWRLWLAAQPKWRPGEWQQDYEIFRKYALDENNNVWVMDLPPLP